MYFEQQLLISTLQSADVFARFCRARGLTTLYVCGSDEYGTATETKALAEGLDPATLCAKYHQIHKEIYDWFRIDFDVFGRTPTPEHTEIVQEIFTQLWNNGCIEERESTQAFCPVPSHSSFLADRFVEGECSICHDLGARGDQVWLLLCFAAFLVTDWLGSVTNVATSSIP